MSKKAASRGRPSTRRTSSGPGKSEQTKAPQQRLSREIVIEIVLERYAGYRRRKQGKLTSPADVRKWLATTKGLDVREDAIARHMARAFRQGWVEVRARPGLAPARRWKRRPQLEEELIEAYEACGLQSAIVIGGIPPADKLASIADPFYQALGEAMADRIAKGLLIRNKDKVGVGTGRAVYNVIKALGKHGHLHILEPTLVSLAGNAWQRTDGLQRSVDSDFNVTLFRECFSKAHQRYIGYPLTEAQSRDNTWLSTTTWKREICPNIALLGVGSVRRNHRFWVEPDDSKGDTSPDLDAVLLRVKDDLKELSRLLIRTDDIPQYSPVADVTNHFVFIPDPDQERRRRNLFNEQEIKARIKDLNDKFLSARDDQFEGINSIALIAGEVNKACAIRGLLADPHYNVEVLCTDEATAKELLSLAERYPLEA